LLVLFFLAGDFGLCFWQCGAFSVPGRGTIDISPLAQEDGTLGIVQILWRGELLVEGLEGEAQHALSRLSYRHVPTNLRLRCMYLQQILGGPGLDNTVDA